MQGVSVKVSDNGAGMAPENMARIFSPFFTTKGPKGTGLGLAVAHSLVTSAGGEIHVESAPGTGTTFELRFPTTA